MSDDLRRRLDALGSVGTPPVTDARLDVIEARAMQATLAETGRRRAAPLLLAAAAFVALLVAGVLFAAGGNDGGTLRLVAADGVTVEFIDDRTVAGVEGLTLDEGAIVDIGLGGSAIVGADRYGPGRYRVVDGHLRPLVASSSSTTTATRVTTRVAPTTIGARDRQLDSTRPPIARPSTTIGNRPTATSTRPDRARIDRSPTTVDRQRSTTTSTTAPSRTTTTGPQVTDGRVTTTTTTTTITTTTTADRPTTTTAPPRPDRTSTTTTSTTTTATTTTTTPIDRPLDRP